MPILTCCQWCSAAITPNKQTRIQKFCSPACRLKDQTERRKVSSGSQSGPARCLFCSAAYERRTSMNKWCSTSCREMARGLVLIGPVIELECAIEDCSIRFTPKMRKQRCCCERHGKLLNGKERRERGLDNPGWTEARQERREQRRARMKGVYVGPKAPRLKIADRDGWCCGLCGGHIPRVVRHGHPLYLTIDHIIPLNKGGEHSPSNVQAAHARCNYSKGDRLDTAA